MTETIESARSARAVERVWGRRELPDGFAQFQTGAAIGEIWHEHGGGDPALLVKHLFTNERLSIQVHPDDRAAQARGYSRGKDEAWLVIDAEPGAVIGLGLHHAVDRDALRQAALDGGIEQLLDWRPVKRGDFLYAPAGTVHAIGAGLSVIEVQQNLDLTYRLYDYGRPRELHLDDGVAVADPRPWTPQPPPRALNAGRLVLVEGRKFVVEQWTLTASRRIAPAGMELLLIPTEGAGSIGGKELRPGMVHAAADDSKITADGSLTLLAAYPGAAVSSSLLSG